MQLFPVLQHLIKFSVSITVGLHLFIICLHLLIVVSHLLLHGFKVFLVAHMLLLKLLQLALIVTVHALGALELA